MGEDLVLGRKATLEEVEAIKDAIAILDSVDLVLVSTKPKPRPQ